MTSSVQGKWQTLVENAAIFIIFAWLNWASACLVLWWSYNMSHSVLHGGHTQAQAVTLVTSMGFIITVLTIGVWTLWTKTADLRWQSVWNVSWKTSVVLGVYGLVVMVWRVQWDWTQLGDPYLPITGRINVDFSGLHVSDLYPTGCPYHGFDLWGHPLVAITDYKGSFFARYSKHLNRRET